MMLRGNLQAAFAGLAVVPIFAGYDRAEESAGCGTTTSPAAATRSTSTSPPARAACMPARSSRSATAEVSTVPSAIRLVAMALWEAADADSATGGPDSLRGIYPIVATITADGFVEVDDDELAETFSADRRRGARAMTMPFYVAPEQVMKDRADYARKGIAKGTGTRRHPLLRRDRHRRRDDLGDTAQDQRDLRPHRLRRCRSLQRVRPAARRRRPRRRPQGLPVQPRRRRRPQPRQPLCPAPRSGVHPRDEADGGGDPRRRGRVHTRR